MDHIHNAITDHVLDQSDSIIQSRISDCMTLIAGDHNLRVASLSPDDFDKVHKLISNAVRFSLADVNNHLNR